ncbi:MAG: alternative ribosome rescue aminoacyl-tRNA hydrolase ArfB [Nannocystaceae bacterium]
MTDLRIGPALTLPSATMRWTAVRASGPGGQNVNCVATKVDLRFDLEACGALPAYAKARLRHIVRGRLDGQGRVVITSCATRNRDRNLQDARMKLAALVRVALQRPKPRRPTKPSRGSVRRRLVAKRRRGEAKRARGTVSTDD